jgi:hypothetical protein
MTTAGRTVTGQSVTTGFEINVTNTLGQLDLTKTDDTTSVIATAVNDPPTLVDPLLSYTVAEGQTLQNLYAQLLANAQDLGLGYQAQLTISTLGLLNSAKFLYFDAGDRMLTCTADGFNAAKPAVGFTYTISDPQGATVTGTVGVAVTGPALSSQVGSAGVDTLTADGSSRRLIGGDGNDKLQVLQQCWSRSPNGSATRPSSRRTGSRRTRSAGPACVPRPETRRPSAIVTASCAWPRPIAHPTCGPTCQE